MSAKTIFDVPIVRTGRERGAYSFIGPEHDAASDEPEKPKVAADPPLLRHVVSYMEPREGIDGKQRFGSCASCSSFIPESLFRGAVRGDRCALFGSTMSVTDDSGCNLWTAWPGGRPDGDCQDETADAIIRGQGAAVSPWDANFVVDKRRQCGTCRHMDYAGDTTRCALLAEMTAKLPAVFDLKPEVSPNGKCNLWTDPPPPEPMA